MQTGDGNYQAEKIRIKNGTIKTPTPKAETTFFCWCLLASNFITILLLIIGLTLLGDLRVQLNHHDKEASRFINAFEQHRMFESHAQKIAKGE